MTVKLPILDIISELESALQTRDEVVLEAPPGAGKTTQVPLSLLSEPWLQGQKILMLEPRRLAARAAAERMAQTLGEAVGETVGYRVRLDSRVGPNTRIEVVTEGILTRLLQADPSLEGVGLVIFDEFHERSLDADLGLALTLQGRLLFGDVREQPLKLLIMSATLDGQRVSEFLHQAPVVRSEGKMFPVELRYGAPYRYGERIAERVVATVMQALEEQAGSVLVFLPGQGEIRQVYRQLQGKLGGSESLLLCPLYGDLSLAEQRRAIAPCQADSRKVVLATSIAETSLTIEGVRVVVDSGLSRLPAFDPNTGMTRLATQRVSKASATQRCGRAGRLEQGVCYRLWAESQQNELAAFTPPEIHQADLSPLALQLLNWGVSELSELDWLESPAPAPYQQALELLQQLGAAEQIDATEPRRWRLTAMGDAMLRLPAHPRLAHLMVKAKSIGQTRLGAELAAVLSERDFVSGAGVDVQLRLELLRGDRVVERSQKGVVARLKQQQQHFERLLTSISVESLPHPGAETAVGLLLAFAYPDRIARQRSGNRMSYQLSNGRSADFIEQDSLGKQSWLAVASVGGQQGRSSDRIYLAAALNPELLDRYFAGQIEEKVCVEWDERAGKLRAERERKIGRLVIERQPLEAITAAERRQALAGLVQRRGLDLFEWPVELMQWRARVQLMRSYCTDLPNPWPDVSDTGLLQSLSVWLEPYLSAAEVAKISKLNHFKALDVTAMLHGLLPWPLPQQLDEQAPQRFAVPSGARIAIDYTQSPPVLAVKLQEMFGCVDTPAVAGGRVKLMVHLLSPARRPLQVTQDLAGFWQGSYQAVKKEMKGRYPKHPWPDNPLEAVATAKTKARM
ncbi:ATP-dependent helicase HrpB [Aestuariicella hydrocarbonica]|uniref:ATP-dependent helicase HrpB n=1 Tax=Pseudomaricurvus hydrocarbonicus TaxID=1470433 RepID=A0A9E5JRR1_9GAMM|nr:ATP-dependent helicase HrpB [Aestuariicella hydrocarbonica]NHO65577.1 ATP-dependent helicase HrpB [Aestuariicella hydrocarbonica]